MTTYNSAVLFDTADVGYDVGTFDMGTLLDAISLSIIDSKATSGNLSKAEYFSITDVIKHIIFFAETFHIADTYVKSGIKNLAEVFNIVDTFIKSGIRNLSEGFGIIDSKITNTSLALAESFSIADTSIKNGIKNLVEAFHIVDTYPVSATLFDTAGIGYDVGGFDEIKYIDAIVKTGSLAKSESFTIADTKGFVIWFTETLSIIDSSVRTELTTIRMKIRKIAIRFMGGKYESDIELED